MLAGCSALSPQIFSDRLLVERAADGTYKATAGSPPRALAEVVTEVQKVQGRYIAAVAEQSNATPQLGAGLVGLSALALLATINGSSAKDVAGIGVAGAAGYTYGNSLISRPRLDVYRAGAAALACALTAAEPFREGQATLGQPGDGLEKETLYGLRQRVKLREATLTAKVDAAEGLTRTVNKVVAEAKPQVCRQTSPRPTCAAAPAGATASEAQALAASCLARQKAWDKGCTPAQLGEVDVEQADPAALAAISEAKSELKAVKATTALAQRTISALAGAGPLLWDRSVAIQLKVSEEVDKTVPSLAAIFEAARAQGGIAARLTAPEKAASEAAQPMGKLEGARVDLTAMKTREKNRTLTAGETDQLAEIRAATVALRTARVSLDTLAADALGPHPEQAQKALAQCAVEVKSTTLRVFPPGDSATMAAGETRVFYVASGGQVPVAEAEANGERTALPVRLEGGQFRFDYTVPATAQAGDTVVLHFRDGTAFEHTVTVTVGEAPAAAASTAPASAGGSRPSLAKDMDPDTLARLGLAAGATDAQIYAAIDRCQASGKAPKTGLWDAATQQAFKSGACKAA
ncbi:hypothetical protein AACH06_23575 [Ideonella sp. DXS29W]|uniref:Uncharacterized protein n=1 Tax=Ideonella lacteola TaxID=2984193 RepID=A0ABU9BZ24_9BURK